MDIYVDSEKDDEWMGKYLAQIDEWMHGWMNLATDRWVDAWMDESCHR